VSCTTRPPCGSYQARELSYACDLADSYLISACFIRGLPHMLSGSFMALVAILIGVHHWLCRRVLGLDALTTAALGILLVSTFCVSHGGQYFRSAKIGSPAATGFPTRRCRSSGTTWQCAD
jgi:multisubunit Na+/H+ antiporter MnhF subunit